MDENTPTAGLDLIWTAEAIAREIGRKPGITAHMLEQGHIPVARKVCGRWCVSKQALREFFHITEAA